MTNSRANLKLIKRILTLRYDPDTKTTLKPLNHTDFIARPIDNVESKIINIVSENLRSFKSKAKRIVVSLSAGIDSGFTLSMVKKFLPDVKVSCVSMGFGDKDDEVKRASEIARKYDCDFHSIIRLDVLSELPKIISIVKEPRWNIYQYHLFDEAKRISDTFYSGDGGDELFGGYIFRYKKFISKLKKGAGWEEKVRLYLSCHERDWVPDQEEIFALEVKFVWEDIYKIFKGYFDNNLSPIDQVFLADFNGKLLHDWIPVNNAMGAFFDLDIRSVFLTKEMINFATHLPWQTKYNFDKNIGKLPLQAILKKQKGFEDITNVKKGFSVPLGSLWKAYGKEISRRYLNSKSEIIRNKIISEDWLEKTFTKLNHELDERYINKVFGILALEIWYNLFISKKMKSNQKL